MKGDFSRLGLDPDPYSRVLMQQGRVMVDSDWNDHVAMVVGSHRRLAADLIGPHGGPSGRLGFGVAPVSTDNKRDLTIGTGAYYVDGLRCVNAGTPAGGAFRFLNQPYLASAGMDGPPEGAYLVYLDVWERHVTSLEDDAIREVALGGPDTTSRAQVVWQVRVQPLSDDAWEPFVRSACKSFDLDALRLLLTGNRPRLKAKVKEPDDVADDPCLSASDAGYRGAENQLYRVEIHAVDEDGATFVWSRENGSVVAEWLSTEGDDLRVVGIRDKVRGFEAGDWVELTDDRLELGSEAGVLVRLARVDRDRLTVDRTTATGPISSKPADLVNARVRRWDQHQRSGEPLAGGAVRARPGTGAGDWIDLENGIQVQFQPPAANITDYRVGDHWVFPARVATGDIIWPRDTAGEALAVTPHGVEHHYAPLAVIHDAVVVDLRHQFDALAACVPM